MLLLLIIGFVIITVFIGNPLKQGRSFEDGFDKKKNRNRFK